VYKNKTQQPVEGSPVRAANPTGVTITILDGSSSGVTWFDPEIGKTIDTTMNQDITMVIRVPLNLGGNRGGAGQMQNLTNQMTQAVNIKLSSVK